ncbi:MAG: helix-turn-helix domain-containing protein [Clostridia bacterium]|jgi:hypothetical protein|nr:helix-turn-helix domain-containing protein [Clostridia bacterium]
MHQEIFDPYEAKRYMGITSSKPAHVPDHVTDPDAVALWNTVMVSVSSYDKKILPVPMTVSRSLGDAVQRFMTDSARIQQKFGCAKISAKQVYESIHMSRPTWNRITGGQQIDVERGNVFAIALGLRLDEQEVQELLYSAGFALNYSLELDAAIMYFIKKGIYDVEYIYRILSQFSDIKNGLDCFCFRPCT